MRRAWASILLVGWGVSLGAQTAPSTKPAAAPDCSSATAKTPGQTQPCPSQPASAADRFPYPGEAPTPAKVTPSAPVPSSASQSGDPSKQFPYPGDPEASSSSSASGSSSSRAGDDMPPDAAEPPARGRRILPKVKQLQSDEDRESEDLEVAKYYRQAGNMEAAYLRAKDAVRLAPGDSEAHFALAEAAQHLNKRDEASTEFAAYLKLDPDGDRAKSVKKALASLK